jgi:hypothetical protein
MTFEATKDPDSVEDFTINWAATLSESSPGDVISTSSWTANSDVTIDSDTNTTTTARVWVSGGTLHKYADLVNAIETSGGRTYNRTITLKIQEK